MRAARTTATSGKGSRVKRTPAKRLGAADVLALVQRVQELSAGSEGGVERVRRELQTIDRRCSFSRQAWAMFQDLLGRLAIATARPIRLPLDSRPFWFRFGYPFAGYRTRPALPEAADVVVIGAGLTGASAAYHLIGAVRERNWRVVVLDQGDPAGEASGRNGGNFELIPENAVGIYEGLAVERMAFLQRQYPRVPSEVLHAVSERQASLVLGLALRNRDLLKGIILREGIDCDFSPKGWLYLAGSEQEERGICEELSLAAQHGQRIEIWSRGKIRDEFGFGTDYLGRFIPGDGTYHPVKYVCGVLQSALTAGVELYARVPVTRIESLGAESHRVLTEEGTIAARRVIVATNAFTSRLFPELKAIRPYQSQVMVTENAPDRAHGRIVTSEHGPVFFNQPRDGAEGGRAPLLMGGGADRPMRNPSSRRRSPAVHALLMRLRDHFFPELRGRPPSAEWVGPMGFTPDQLPCIGFLRPGVVIAAGFNGYGGSYTTAAGHAAAEMVSTGSVPEWVPEDVFSPHRLLTSEPVFMSEKDSLWRIAVSLCRQLKSVNVQISEVLTLLATPQLAAPSAPTPAGHAWTKTRSTAAIAPELLMAFPVFAGFSRSEIEDVLSLMARWACPKETQLFAAGDPGGTCFVVVRGEIDVTLPVRGDSQFLARLPAGSIFGQVSLITGEPRNATCSVHSEALLLELERGACERFLAGQTRLALKFLAALNQGLISALRGADRRLMQLNAEYGGAAAPADGAEAAVPSAPRASSAKTRGRAAGGARLKLLDRQAGK